MYMMKVLVLSAIALLCQFFSPTVSSMIKLNNGGYEDIVIAINPSVTEDLKIITSIQNMVKDATSYLFNATRKRVFIQSVKILIPSTWSRKNYNKSTIETYDKADIIIAQPHLKYGDDPYTLQYGKCGDAGKYIHFTPNFFVDDTIESLYGPRGRAFVHEWAHLRWGVYDEYSTEKPYYISSSKKPEATRCSRRGNQGRRGQYGITAITVIFSTSMRLRNLGTSGVSGSTYALLKGQGATKASVASAWAQGYTADRRERLAWTQLMRGFTSLSSVRLCVPPWFFPYATAAVMSIRRRTAFPCRMASKARSACSAALISRMFETIPLELVGHCSWADNAMHVAPQSFSLASDVTITQRVVSKACGTRSGRRSQPKWQTYKLEMGVATGESQELLELLLEWCSFDIFGTNIKSECTGNVCNTRPCNFDPSNYLYEEGCVFVPEKKQFVKNSIMFMQSLSDITEFCDSHNHNIEAENLHNKLCSLRSTWDIIMNSSDIRSTPQSSITTIPVPTFQLLQYSRRVITLVLDVSGSMTNNNRINRLYQAADIFLTQVIELNAYVGLVKFSNMVSIISPLTEITGDDVREQLKNSIPNVASGGTDICLGILKGIEVNKQYDGLSDGTEIILLSDGEDNYNTRVCIPDIEKSGAIFNVIALGPNEEPALKEIVSMTGGTHILATDKVDANGLIDAFSSFSASDGDIYQQSIQLESTGLSLKTAECLNGTVYIDSALGNETVFLVTWQSAVPDIHLQDPKTNVYTASNFISDSSSKSSKLQIPGTAETGPWHYSICNALVSTQAIGIVVNSKAAEKDRPPITVTAQMNQNTNTYPNPMVVYAFVTQGMMPVSGAKVTAIIEPVLGNAVTLELLDNGAGADIIMDDGVYSRYFTAFTENGRYSLKIRVESTENKSRLRLPQNRALYVPGYLNNGTVTMNPPQPKFSDEDFKVDAFSRTVLGGSFLLSNVPTGPQRDIYPPEKITDLEAKIESDKVVLLWTATGDDLDQGSATSYDLRMSNNPMDLRDNFYSSTKVNISSITPLSAGSRETFEFVPEDITIENGTILYFALVASDKVAQSSDVSNIAKAALFIPPTPAPTPALLSSTEPEPTTSRLTAADTSASNMNITHLALIVCSAIILICLITSITICIVSCQKKMSIQKNSV
ncbi:calcium-activated chloride channel regulator 1-like [Mantella aurantiaca]